VAENAGKTVYLQGIILPGVVFAVLDHVLLEAEKILGMPGEVIFKEGLKKFLLSKAEENDRIIDGLKKKYGASGFAELEEKIKTGRVPEHPAWEDVILWEELSSHAEKLRELALRLEAGEAVAS
jgi:hypothetical protein